jgi:polysaccharide pyruvyl transferase WcaK-like protein
MRILVDSCAYSCQNVGDLAMLTVAVSRLRQLWPAASTHVITGAPQTLAIHCRDVAPVPLSGRRLVLQDRLLGRFEKLLPSEVAGRWGRVERRLRLRHPALVKYSLQLKGSLTGRDSSEAVAFLSAIDSADLLVVSGAGVLTDAFPENALGVLATLEMAIQRGIPTAMFGQGVGPILSPELRARAADVLPHVGLIGVRERLASLPLLISLGVKSNRVVVTGDDAIEMALPAAPASLEGSHQTSRKIGVNVRVASYAEVDREHLGILREALRTASRAHGAELVPVPIAHRGEMDVSALRELLAECDVDDLDGGASLDTPQRVIDRIRQCRVVVTGSYHAAVFALAQGIPAVALAGSRYYLDKMLGLADQFGGGCEVVTLEPAAGVASRIIDAVAGAWNNADRLRPALLARAADQVARGRDTYARVLPRISSQAGNAPGSFANDMET